MVDIIGVGSQRDPKALKLFTLRNKNFIENEIPDEDRNPNALMTARELWASIFPEIRSRSLTAMYNCAGMVFAARRTCISNMRDIDLILRDDDYRRLSDEGLAEVGDLVVYRRIGIPRHVGIVFEKVPDLEAGQQPFHFRILSQWGDDGEYLHRLRDVPTIFGDQIEFWSDRK